MDKEHYFIFLDEIRDSGSINMFGAAPYLEDMFGLTRYEAKDILIEWMQTYSTRHSVGA